MTPKEKAKELLENYEFVYIPNYTSMYDVKVCALIAVDEILEALDLINEKYNKFSLEFYVKVKEEIEKL